MNMRADNFHSSSGVAKARGALVTFRNPAGLARRSQASIVAVAGHVAAVVFDTPAGEGRPGRRRLAALLDGAPLGNPMLATALDTISGGTRHVVLLRQSVAELARRRVILTLDDIPVSSLDPDWLQSPVADSAALVGNLTAAARRRLLKLLLTTGASLFGLAADEDFGGMTRQLLDLLGGASCELACLCPVGKAGAILTWRLGTMPVPRETDTFVLKSAARIAAVKGHRLLEEATSGGSLLHVFLPGRLPEAARLVALAETPLRLIGPEAATEAQPLVPWMARRSARTRAWVRDIVAEHAERDSGAAALLREIRATEGHRPEAVVRHLSATASGLLHAIEIRDPLDLVAAIRLEVAGGYATLPITAACNGVVAGHLRLIGAPESCRIRLVYRSGRLQTLREAPVPAFDGRVPECFAELERPVAAGLVARARADRGPRQLPVWVSRFGPAPADAAPDLSLVVPIGGNPDILRARAAMLFAERGAERVELVYHGSEAAMTPALRRMIAECHAPFGLSGMIVTLRGAAEPAEALRAALAAARGAWTLVLGADVLPEGPGWLAAWRRAFRKRAEAMMLGGTLLGPDGSVLDAGGLIGRDGACQRRGVGLMPESLPRATSAPTALLSAECAGLSNAAKETLLSSPCLHPNPDILLAGTAVRVGAAGGRVRTAFRGRFVRYRTASEEDPISIGADMRAIAEAARGAGGDPEAKGTA